MMAASGIFLLLLFAIISVFGQDNDTVTSNRGVFVKVLGNSGKISLSRNSANESDVVIEFDAIGEKAADGSTDVGRGGSPNQKHVFNTFANQQFQFSGVRNGTYRNISAKTFNFAANISSGAKLLVDVYIFSENGTFSLGDENTTVSEGSVKFNIQIDNWKFCGSDSGAVECKQGQTLQVGKYLDFTISIKGKGANPQKKAGGKKRTTADEYDLGGGSVVLSNKVKYDGGQWVNMPSGYPNVVTQGSKQLFVFRFENFTKGLLYDPQVDLDPAATNTTTVTTTTTLAPPPDSPPGANQDGIYVKVTGRSGKIQLGNKADPSSDPDRITIEFSDLTEKKSDGTDIKDSKHVFNNFAKTDFVFTPLVGAVYPNTSINVKKFTFKSNLNDAGATLETEVYIFQEDGNITLGNENTIIHKGNMKFSTTIANWTFCGHAGVPTCTQSETGAFLDFGIVIKGKGTPRKKSAGEKHRGDSDEYELADNGAAVVMSKKVKYNNGNWVDMATGYPKLDTQGGKQIFIIRFSNFTGKAYYDPTVVYTASPTTVTTTTTLAPPPDSPPGANQDGIYVKVTGRSGKIQLGNKADPSSDPDRITIEFSDLTEKKSDGTDIKDSKHVFNNFAKTDFVFTPLADDFYPNTSIRVKKFTFRSNLNDAGATLETEVYIFKEDGNITLGNESTIIKKGNMKFSTTIANWTFCGHADVPTCTQSETGAFLDFGIVIKGKGTPRKKSAGEKHRGDSDEYELAENGAAVVMSKKVKYNNGNWVDMANGYPQMVTQGGKQIFIIRFSNFTGKAYYDPTVVYTALPTNGSNRNLGSIITFALIALICSVLF